MAVKPDRPKILNPATGRMVYNTPENAAARRYWDAQHKAEDNQAHHEQLQRDIVYAHDANLRELDAWSITDLSLHFGVAYGTAWEWVAKAKIIKAEQLISNTPHSDRTGRWVILREDVEKLERRFYEQDIQPYIRRVIPRALPRALKALRLKE